MAEVWPQVATLKATGWNLLQEPRCADNADVPTLVGAPVWGSTRELLWKLCRSEREKRVNTWWKHHAIFFAWTERGSGSVDFKGKYLELEKKLKNSQWSCPVSQLCSRLLFSEAWASSTKLQKKCQNICIFHGPTALQQSSHKLRYPRMGWWNSPQVAVFGKFTFAKNLSW